MDSPTPENQALPESEMETMLKQLLDTQLALGQSLSSTSQFLRFALDTANTNLEVIHSQLETIRNLATAIDEISQAS